MGRERTKKQRGRKRTAPLEKKPQSTSSSHETRAEDKKSPLEQVAPKPAKDNPVESDRPSRKPSNVLKTKSAQPQSVTPESPESIDSSSGATTPDEVDRWISMIREGGLDRKVQVKGKTGALLVR